MLRGEVTCPQSANSNLSLSDLVAQPSAEALKEQGWATEQKPARDNIHSPGSWAPAPGWRGRGPEVAGGACCARTPGRREKPGRSIAILEKCTSIWLGSVAKMAPPRDRLDPRHIRIRKVATFK